MKDRSSLWVVFLLFATIGGILHAEEKPTTIRFSGIPALGFDPDSGFGGGVVGSMYLDEKGFEPYKMALSAKVYVTLKGVHSHALQLDRINAFDLPLRLISRLGFYSTISQNYCGRASDANCDKDRALIEAENSNLTESQKKEFINHYYKNRSMSFFGEIFARWLLWKDVAKLELMTSYLGRYYREGDFKNKGPYPGSLFLKDFGQKKLDGYLSTLELGLMLDKRDHEPAPSSGYWLESSIRGASFIFGSAWDYIGANAAARFYVPLDNAHKLVFASQTILDAIFGDLPYDAMSRIGGSQSISDFNAIGGQYLGRGISEQLFVGRMKAIEQVEFRYTFFSFELLKQNFDLTAAALGDFGMTAWDLSRFTKDMQHVYAGFGTGLRIYWNRTFVIRADLGVSPSENFSPKFYLVVGNVF